MVWNRPRLVKPPPAPSFMVQFQISLQPSYWLWVKLTSEASEVNRGGFMQLVLNRSDADRNEDKRLSR